MGVAIREETRMNVRYHVELNEAERCELTVLVGAASITPARSNEPRFLLAADSGLGDTILPLPSLSAARPFTGPSAASFKAKASLNEEPRAGADRKLTNNEEALLIATPVRDRRRLHSLDAGAVGRRDGQADRP
jgi:hypothetical protein